MDAFKIQQVIRKKASSLLPTKGGSKSKHKRDDIIPKVKSKGRLRIYVKGGHVSTILQHLKLSLPTLVISGYDGVERAVIHKDRKGKTLVKE